MTRCLQYWQGRELKNEKLSILSEIQRIFLEFNLDYEEYGGMDLEPTMMNHDEGLD